MLDNRQSVIIFYNILYEILENRVLDNVNNSNPVIDTVEKILKEKYNIQIFYKTGIDDLRIIFDNKKHETMCCLQYL